MDGDEVPLNSSRYSRDALSRALSELSFLTPRKNKHPSSLEIPPIIKPANGSPLRPVNRDVDEMLSAKSTSSEDTCSQFTKSSKKLARSISEFVSPIRNFTEKQGDQRCSFSKSTHSFNTPLENPVIKKPLSCGDSLLSKDSRAVEVKETKVSKLKPMLSIYTTQTNSKESSFCNDQQLKSSPISLPNPISIKHVLSPVHFPINDHSCSLPNILSTQQQTSELVRARSNSSRSSYSTSTDVTKFYSARTINSFVHSCDNHLSTDHQRIIDTLSRKELLGLIKYISILSNEALEPYLDRYRVRLSSSKPVVNNPIPAPASFSNKAQMKEYVYNHINFPIRCRYLLTCESRNTHSTLLMDEPSIPVDIIEITDDCQIVVRSVRSAQEFFVDYKQLDELSQYELYILKQLVQ